MKCQLYNIQSFHSRESPHCVYHRFCYVGWSLKSYQVDSVILCFVVIPIEHLNFNLENNFNKQAQLRIGLQALNLNLVLLGKCKISGYWFFSGSGWQQNYSLLKKRRIPPNLVIDHGLKLYKKNPETYDYSTDGRRHQSL